MGSGCDSSSGLGGHRISKVGGDCRGFAIHRCARATLLPLLLFATPLWAQGNSASDVTINHDVLNSLSLPAGAGPQAAKLRPSPSKPPQSRLLVQPVREAARKPATKPPPKESESPQPQAAATKPAPVAKIESTPAPVVSEPAPALSVPAVPQPPEPLESSSGETIAIVPPPPPPPFEPLTGSPPPPEPAAIATVPSPSVGQDQTAKQPARKQVANRPAVAHGTTPLRLRFEEGSAQLTDQARQQLTVLKDQLLSEDAPRVQLMAYAKGNEQQANAARRLSLSRARAVRAFLAERGVPISKIDVRALGTKFGNGPPDRVDVVYAER